MQLTGKDAYREATNILQHTFPDTLNFVLNVVS